MQIPHKEKLLADKLFCLTCEDFNMASSSKSNKDILDILGKLSGEDCTGVKRVAKHPSTAATSFGPDVSLVRNVHVPSIIFLIVF